MKTLTALSLSGTLALSVLIVGGCGNNNAAGGGGSVLGGGSSGGALATVGNETIDKSQLYSLLEATGGEDGLQQLIDYSLVMQDAKAKGIEISDADVDKEVEARKKTNPAIEDVQKRGGPQFDALKRQIRYQKALDGLLTQDIKVDPKALEAWFNKNRARYDEPAKVKIGVLFASTKARADLMAQQLKSGKTFKTLVDEQKNANDAIGKSSINDTTEKTGDAPAPGYLPMTQLPKEMKEAVEKLQPNGTSPVITLGGSSPQKAFAIIKLLDRQAAAPAKASDANVQMDYKLEQAARNLVKENPGNPNFDQTMKQVEQAIQQQAMQQGRFERPTYRDQLNFITQTGVQKILTKLREGAKVSISDPAYSRVADRYKPAATPIAPAGATTMETPATTTGTPAAEAPAASTTPAASASEKPAAEAPAATKAP